MYDDFELRIHENIRKRSLISYGDTGIAAVSGGADSVCLIHILDRLREEFGLRLRIVHVHHGIRGAEADRDAAFVEELAGKLGIPCRIIRADIPGLAREQGMSLEEAGRMERYRLLREEKEAEGAAWIALAHHMDDRVETVVFNMLRGSGLRGMRGILPLQGDLIRPLIYTERHEIEEWLKQKNISWCEDSTNQDINYTRNRIRHMIIPEMLRVNDGAREHIIRLAEDAEQRYEYVRKTAEELLEEAAGNPAYPDPGSEIMINDSIYDRAVLPDVEEELLLQVLERLAGRRKDISARHIVSLKELRGNETGKRISLPYELEGVRLYDGLLVRKKNSVSENINGRGKRLQILRRAYIQGEEIPRDEQTVMLDAECICGEPVLRTPEEGDRIVIDSEGHTKSLNRFFRDRRIPAHLRDTWPVAADEKGVLWVVGLRLSEHCKVTEKTVEAVILSCAEEEKD